MQWRLGASAHMWSYLTLPPSSLGQILNCTLPGPLVSWTALTSPFPPLLYDLSYPLPVVGAWV